MGCPKPQELELLVTGRLSEEAAQSLDQHLRTCEACQRDQAFLHALRLAVTASPGHADQAHLGDEQLAALADGAMAGTERRQAIDHIAACSTCAAGLTAIEQAMDEVLDPADQPTMAPPTRLLNQAIRLGAPGRSASRIPEAQSARPGLLDRFFGAPLLLRLGMAAGVAALVLALTVVLSQPQPGSDARPPDAEGPAVADAPDQPPMDSAADPRAISPDKAPEPNATVATGPGDTPKSDLADQLGPTRDAPTPSPERNHLAALDPGLQAGLASQARPVISRPRVDMAQALAEPDHEPGLSDGYVLGRALGFLERFGPHAGKSVELRGLVSETLLSLESAIRTTLPQGEQADRLVDFANGLGGQLAAGQITTDAAGRRLQVFCVALREALTGQAKIRSGVQLGLLVQGWQTSASADQLGLDVPLQDADALKRARQIIRTDQGLSDQMRQTVLTDLSQVEQAHRQKRSKQRAARILEEISRLDDRVRAGR